jgi:hypothetical protein
LAVLIDVIDLLEDVVVYLQIAARSMQQVAEDLYLALALGLRRSYACRKMFLHKL